MRAAGATLLGFLRKSPQFIIPIYQRTYSWSEVQCTQLWDDILHAGTDESIKAHFIGSVVYIEESLSQVTDPSSLLVIDGQQRIATVSLIIEALARHLGESEPIEGFSAEKLRSYYLLNQPEKGQKRYKLLLTQADKRTLVAIVDQKKLPKAYSHRIHGNYEFFERKIGELGDDVVPLCIGLAKLMLVDIALDRNHDNPQLIFESMNSTGLALSQADLIRNFVLMDLESDRQERLYNDYWRPMELAFGQETYSKEFDAFMRHYLTLRTGEIPKISRVYEAFKLYAQSEIHPSLESLLAELYEFAVYFCAMALGREKEKRLSAAFRDLRELRVDVAYPLLLELYSDYAKENLSLDDFVEAVRYIESYVFRRVVCSIPTNSHNTTFATFSRFLDKERYLESILAYFQWLPSYRRFPEDREFKRELKVRNLYNNRTSYWLRRLENFNRKELVPVDEYTVEHILPQNKNLSQAWQNALGDDWKNIQETWLHTLGNLTLTGYNSEYSDHSFAQKRDREGGFAQSPLRLNQGLRKLDTWNEDTIRARARRLADKAARVWQAPSLSPEILASYEFDVIPRRKTYTIKDHYHLRGGSSTRQLFEEFRKEVLAIDPCVSEEFLKQYVAYKAETNFVDVVPQASRMRMVLNVKFHELNDPRGLAEDVTNLGRWGNGDAEIRVSSLDDLPYVLGLVRQAFEKQMDHGEEQE